VHPRGVTRRPAGERPGRGTSGRTSARFAGRRATAKLIVPGVDRTEMSKSKNSVQRPGPRTARGCPNRPTVVRGRVLNLVFAYPPGRHLAGKVVPRLKPTSRELAARFNENSAPPMGIPVVSGGEGRLTRGRWALSLADVLLGNPDRGRAEHGASQEARPGISERGLRAGLSREDGAAATLGRGNALAGQPVRRTAPAARCTGQMEMPRRANSEERRRARPPPKDADPPARWTGRTAPCSGPG